MSKCKCKTNPRIVSNVVSSLTGKCYKDVCTCPIYDDPHILGAFLPVIYDEIGVNLCTTIDVGTDIATTYPTADHTSVNVIGLTYQYGEDNVQISTIPGRPYCRRVTLSNITAQLEVHIYDCCERLLGTLYPTAVYLPSDTTAPTYDEDTNPSSIELDIFAPYGSAYNTTVQPPTPILNNIGFVANTGSPAQGLNLYGMVKLLDEDLTASTITVGLTLVLQSLYYAGYKISVIDKIDVPKGSILTPDESSCMRFVAGDLLNLSIKPLDLGDPAHEEDFKFPSEDQP